MPFEVHDERAAQIALVTQRERSTLKRHVALLGLTLAVVVVPNLLALAAHVLE